MEILNTEAVDLKQRYPIHEEPISEKETVLSECWNELQEKVWYETTYRRYSKNVASIPGICLQEIAFLVKLQVVVDNCIDNALHRSPLVLTQRCFEQEYSYYYAVMVTIVSAWVLTPLANHNPAISCVPQVDKKPW